LNIDHAKLIITISIATCSWLVLRALRDRPGEARLLDRFTVAAFAGRVLLAPALYLAAPGLVRHSDTIAFYLPQTESLLSGRLPYRDFITSYGPLFHALLAPAVALWRSPAAIVMVMLAAEALLLFVYRRFGARNGRDLRFARGAWLMASSPIMVYWVGVTGYNAVLIALFSMLGLVLACGGRPVAAGLLGSCSWIACKALGVLSWPTIVLARRHGAGRRFAAFAGVAVALGAAMLAGFDVLMPLRLEKSSWTGGNVWFLAAVAVPGFFGAPLVTYLSAGSFIAVWTAATRRWLRRRRPEREFDAAAAHLSFILAAFMLLSTKTPVMYAPMVLPFAVHVLLERGSRLRALVPILLLGALATARVEGLWLRDILTSRHLLSTGSGLFSLGLELAKMGAILALAIRSWQALATPDEPSR